MILHCRDLTGFSYAQNKLSPQTRQVFATITQWFLALFAQSVVQIKSEAKLGVQSYLGGERVVISIRR